MNLAVDLSKGLGKLSSMSAKALSVDDFKRWGSQGGKGGSRDDKVRAAKERWRLWREKNNRKNHNKRKRSKI